jgi:anti-anti-sigma factor
MEFKTEKTEQYALIRLNEPTIGAENVEDFEKVFRNLFREGYSNIILDLKTVQDVDNQGLGLIRKVNKMCTNELGLFILVTKSEELTETLDSAKIADLTIMPTIEEAVDAVFMNELENDFKEEEDDEVDEYGFGEMTEGEGGSNRGGGDDEY